MPDLLGHAVGPERWELLQRAAGIDVSQGSNSAITIIFYLLWTSIHVELQCCTYSTCSQSGVQDFRQVAAALTTGDSNFSFDLYH